MFFFLQNFLICEAFDGLMLSGFRELKLVFFYSLFDFVLCFFVVVV